MNILTDAEDMRSWSAEQQRDGLTIGFAPTMGALHGGHEHLIQAAVENNDAAVVSIFVNPTQFGPTEDYERYPRTFDDDCAKAREMGVLAVYAPDAATMYPSDYSTYVVEEHLSSGLCGPFRPGHYRGVCTVVCKLFNAVMPHRAYFGQKDAQQTAIIKRMTRDLDFGVDIVEMPIVRDADGLAMSSRNAYLSGAERVQAATLYQSLQRGESLLNDGIRDVSALVDAVKEGVDPAIKLDYVELVDADSLEPLKEASGAVLLAVAGWVGKTRLIDNIKVEVS